METKLTKDFKFVSYFNVLMVLISSLILFVPMILYLQQLQQNPQTFIPAATNKTANLATVISLIFITTSLIIIFGWWWIRDLKLKTQENLSLTNFKWVLVTIGVNIVSVIFFTVAFFCLWLVPINGSDEQIAHLNRIRFLSYIITYACLLFFFLLASIGCLTWTNLRISYALTKVN